MRHIRIFLSSPGDVPDERDCVRKVIKDVLSSEYLFRNHAALDVISWDDPDAPSPMSAHLTPQEALKRGLPSPADCDIVIVIMWSRLGTKLPESIVKPDGTRFESGTDFEFYTAMEAARSKGSPKSILLYRRTETPRIPLTLTDEELGEARRQLAGVNKFFSQFRNPDGSLGGSVHSYEKPEEFEKVLTSHLREQITKLLEQGQEHKPEPPPSAEELFSPPQPANVVSRKSAVDELEKKHAAASIVIITGLSGNGKTVLASELSNRLLTGKRIAAPIWIACQQNESLESLMARLSGKVGAAGQNVNVQCSKLMAYLRRENAVLFLDDYQGCNHESMDPLLSLAANQGSPARLVLVSRIRPDEVVALPGVEVFQVPNFTDSEAINLLEQRGVVGLDPFIVRDLVAKTAALPLAMALFCGLVKVGVDPHVLLAGDLIEAERLKRWYDELARNLSDRAMRLLGNLSLVEGAFDETIVQMFMSGRDETSIRREFASLQRVFLVERYAEGRWKVHDLVASIGKLSLPRDLVASAYADLGGHFQSLAAAYRSTDREAEFEYAVKACKAYDRAGEREDKYLERLLSLMAPEIKRRGAHIVFLELSRNLINGRVCSDLWLFYHYGHSCFVLGLNDEAMEYSRRILQSAAGGDSTLRLSASRLYAEALAAIGDHARAHESLNAALDATRGKQIRPTSYAQAQSVMAGIETNLGNINAAHRLIMFLMEEAKSSPNPLAKPIALCRMGFLLIKLNSFDEALKTFDEALSLFRYDDNPRGVAWALVGLARADFGAGRRAECADHLKQAFPIHEEIGSYDREYELTLKTFQAGSQDDRALREIVDAELARIEGLKLERRSMARRLHGAV